VKVTIPLLALLVVSSGYFINDAFAEISENQPFLLEGSGFAVTEESINFSEIDLGLSSQQQRGSSIDLIIEDGFFTIGGEDFLVSELPGKFLREGKYIRINGNVISSNGLDTSISFFGRLVEESKDGSVYGFTGRITTSDDTYKIIYTAKLSNLSQITPTSTPSPTESEKSEDIILYILRGSTDPGINQGKITDEFGTFRSQVQGGGDTLEQAIAQQSAEGHLKLRYFSQDRLNLQPGDTITIVNDDVASHSVVSGKENYKSRNTSDLTSTFTPDGRIVTESIPPGGSITITFDEMGFYRLYDPDYPWMKIIAYVFPEVPGSQIIKDYGNPKN